MGNARGTLTPKGEPCMAVHVGAKTNDVVRGSALGTEYLHRYSLT